MSGVDLSAECMTFFVLLHFLGILQVLHRTKERQKKKKSEIRYSIAQKKGSETAFGQN